MKKTVAVEPDGRNLLEILTGQFYELPSFCAGRGTCKKCKVRVRKDGEEAEVLACQYIPEEPCQVEFLQEEREFWVEERVYIEREQGEKIEGIADSREQDRQVAVDIGTTTLAMLLLDGKGNILSSWTGLNSQRKYGADVISRIERANKGEKQILTDCIRADILRGLKSLCDGKKISRVVVAGNTTMQHLFAGYPVDGLGRYPFSVAQKNLVVGRLEEFYSELPDLLRDAEYVSMPCISAFVGGDIMAGILEVERQIVDRKREGRNWLLLDLGTNGEMVLYSEGVYYTASAAAGPVLEGGNISCGTGSVAGAIDHVWERNGEVEYSTIGGEIPIGICGTGLIESIAVLRRMGILEQSGLLAGYAESGYLLARGFHGDMIRITQEDIRQFQLAKAAIRSGIEILCQTAGVDVQGLERIYLAGGFGTKLDVKKSCEVGLLPLVSRNRYRVIGNASLGGCRVYCMEKNMGEELERVQESAKKVTLALKEEFQVRYLEYMCF